MKYPEIYFRNNTAGTLSLLEAMLATGHDRLVFSSTAACYGEPERTPIVEDAKLAPTNPYGESKLLSEYMMRWMSQAHGSNLPHCATSMSPEPSRAMGKITSPNPI